MFKAENRTEQGIALLLIVLGVLMRLAPHPDNFTPVMAIALFGGVVLSTGIALSLPLLIMIVSDLVIGPHPLFWLTWGAFFVMSLAGIWVGRKPGAFKIALTAAGGSVFFFAATNLGVFAFQNMYEKSLAGLAQCYIAAIPFFRNELLGNCLYTLVFFGAFYLSRLCVRRLAPVR